MWECIQVNFAFGRMPAMLAPLRSIGLTAMIAFLSCFSLPYKPLFANESSCKAAVGIGGPCPS